MCQLVMVSCYEYYSHCNIVPIINFNQSWQSTYNVDEDDGSAQPVLVLSNPSSTDITISVFSTDGSATGKDTLLPSTLTH